MNVARKHFTALTIVAFVFAAAVAVGCGGNDNNNSPTGTPTASVQGYWEITSYGNPGVATLSGCSGDLTPLNGVTIDSNYNAGCESEWQFTSQNGTTYTSEEIPYSCSSGDDDGTQHGGGTVDGNNITGMMLHVSSTYDMTITEHYAGTKTGATSLSLSLSKLAATGSITGSCNVAPALTGVATIHDTMPPTANRSPGRSGLGIGNLGRYLRRGTVNP